MSVRPLDCAQIRAGFVAGAVPTGPQVEDHLRSCPACRGLFDGAGGAAVGCELAGAVLPEVEAGDLFALVERDVKAETGLRARLRALPTPLRLGSLLGVALVVVAGHTLMEPRQALGGPYSPAALWSLLAALLAGLFLGARWLLRGVSAASGGRERSFALGLLALPALVALLSPLGAARAPEALEAWGNPAECFGYGALSGLPLLVMYWLFERRDRIPLSALVSAGALSGIAANALLHCHCASAHLPHLLLGHASIGFVWALLLAATRLERNAQR
jgi:hypothetical protein